MPTNEPQNPHERAVRLVLGYPPEGPIPTVADFPDSAHRPRRCVRVVHATALGDEDERANDTRTFHVLVGKAWMHMLSVTGRPVGGPRSPIRCVCVEAALREYVLRELAGGLGFDRDPTFGATASDVRDLHRRLAADPDTLLTAFESPLYADARVHIPLAAVVRASGLRVDVEDRDVPAKLVAHVEACSIPYPVKIVVGRALDEVVGDES